MPRAGGVAAGVRDGVGPRALHARRTLHRRRQLPRAGRGCGPPRPGEPAAARRLAGHAGRGALAVGEPGRPHARHRRTRRHDPPLGPAHAAAARRRAARLPNRSVAPPVHPRRRLPVRHHERRPLYRWDVRPSSWARHACAVAGRKLTRPSGRTRCPSATTTRASRARSPLECCLRAACPRYAAGAAVAPSGRRPSRQRPAIEALPGRSRRDRTSGARGGVGTAARSDRPAHRGARGLRAPRTGARGEPARPPITRALASTSHGCWSGRRMPAQPFATLTALFEEARFSQHPIPESARRATRSPPSRTRWPPSAGSTLSPAASRALRGRRGSAATHEVVGVLDHVAHHRVRERAVERHRVPVPLVEVIAGPDLCVRGAQLLGEARART